MIFHSGYCANASHSQLTSKDSDVHSNLSVTDLPLLDNLSQSKTKTKKKKELNFFKGIVQMDLTLILSVGLC